MLTQKTGDYIDQIDRLETAYDVFKYTRCLGREFGAERFTILALDQDAKGISDISFTNNWDPELVQIYNDENLLDASPVIDHCRTGVRPLAFSTESLPVSGKPNKHKLLLELAHDFKMTRGLACPIVAHGGYHGAISFTSREIEVDQNDIPTIHLLTNYLFNRIVEISGQTSMPVKVDEAADLLSPREKDCLAWAAAGKTATEIGIILEISANTATHYLTAAAKKLNATNRVHAVAEAIRRRLLD